MAGLELEKSFEKATKDIHIDNAYLEKSSEFRAMELVNFHRDHFFPYETLRTSLKVKWDETMERNLAEFLKDNLSVLIFDKSTEKIIACTTIRIERENDPRFTFDNEKLKIVSDFLGHKNKEMDVYKYFGVTTALNFYTICTHKDYRCKGLATKAFEASLEFAKMLGVKPVCIYGEGTGHASQRIFEKFGFTTIHTMRHSDYKINGKIVFEDTGNVKETKVYVKQL